MAVRETTAEELERVYGPEVSQAGLEQIYRPLYEGACDRIYGPEVSRAGLEQIYRAPTEEEREGNRLVYWGRAALITDPGSYP